MTDVAPINPSVHAEMEAYRQDHEFLESHSGRRVTLFGPLLLRLDGRAFHTLTADMVRPFDTSFEAAMDAVCEQLLNAQLGVTHAYCQSDEITAVIAPEKCPFDARHEKLVSVAASLASGVFSVAIAKPVMFDCRAIETGSDAQALGVLAERQLDAAKNAVTQLAHWTLIGREGMTARQAARKLRPMKIAERRQLCADLGVPLEDMPPERVQGRLCRYSVVPHIGVDPRTGEEKPTTRRRVFWDRPAPDFRRLTQLP